MTTGSAHRVRMALSASYPPTISSAHSLISALLGPGLSRQVFPSATRSLCMCTRDHTYITYHVSRLGHVDSAQARVASSCLATRTPQARNGAR